MALVEVTDLVKVYQGDVRALDGVSFAVAEGETFGFLGPNGAGKTTAIRILVTLLAPTSGEARIAGIDVIKRPNDVRHLIGYAAQFIGVDNDLTGRENLILQGRLHGVAAREAASRADALLDVFQLTEAAGRRAGTYSGGMRRRLDLAQALVHRPRVLFLDEPTTGLDPQTRRALWRYLQQLNDDGVTIFLTTQYLEEADVLTSRLAIIDQGRLVVEGSPAELKSRLGGDVITVTIPEEADAGTTGRAEGVLGALPGAGQVTAYNHSISVFLPDGAARMADVVRGLDAADVPMSSLAMAQPSLDDVFLRYTGDRMRVDEVKAPARAVMGRRRT